MKQNVKIGDKREYRRSVTATDFATFDHEVLHRVCSTFSLARDFEWSSRLFFIDMREADEEGVGTHVSIDHKSPAFEGEEIIFTATVSEVGPMHLWCTIEARVGDRLIATGKTGQKMLKRERLNQLFGRHG
jgi:predicted thioesterase